jgi:nitroreductase
MYINAAKALNAHRDKISAKVSQWVKDNYPYRTVEFEKCLRDVSYIVQALESCLKENNTQHIDFIANLFFKGGSLQLKSTDVELLAYDFLLTELEIILVDSEPESLKYCCLLINRLKYKLQHDNKNYQNIDSETRRKHIAYNWDNEMQIVRQMQQCQRNWDYTKSINQAVIDHLLWQAENAPSKQYEAYYDVYWSDDRTVIEEISKYTWGSTHSRNPPSTWRNTQANANLYILFVAKEPETQLNCHSDGSAKSNKDSARWENAYVSIGIAMGLVMRAAHSLGLRTGCNKSHGDLNGDNFWENRLGILDDVVAGRKKIAYGIGIGYPQEGRPRWETDDYELCIGAGNGSNLTTLSESDPGWQESHPRTNKKFRKVKIIDIRTENSATDPYGNKHLIPSESSIKINTMRKRSINVTEIK